MTADKTKLLVIGLDAFDVHLMRRWIDEGKLPNLCAFENSSRFQLTRNEPGVFAGSVWPSIGSGLGAGYGGRYYTRKIKLNDYHEVRFRPQNLGVTPFWDVLSDAGKRVAVLNVPKFPPSHRLNGIHLTEWALGDVEGEVASYPADFAANVVERYGGYPYTRTGEVMNQPEGEGKTIRSLHGHLRRKLKLSTDLLNEGDWDLFLTVFSESHCAGHYLWHLHDSDYAYYDSKLANMLGDPILQIYQAIDKAVGLLLDNVGPEVPVIIFSSHGMGRCATGTHLLDDILRRLEGVEKPAPISLVQFMRQTTHKTPESLKKLLRPIANPCQDWGVYKDRSQRKCFAIAGNSSHGSVRINLVGREPKGRITAGPQCDEFVDALIADLKNVENAETGEKIVSGIWRSKDIFKGPRLDHLPDIVMEWRGEQPICRVRSPKIGDIERGIAGWNKHGDHTPHGFMMYRAPGVCGHRVEETASVLDLAPTITAALGVSLQNVEGQAWKLS